MDARLRISLHALVLYALTMGLGILAAWWHTIMPTVGAVARLEMTPGNLILFAVVFIGFTYAMVKFVRVARVSLSVFLAVALVGGAQFVVGPWLMWPADWLVALAIAFLPRLVPRVAVHDIAIVIGIAGVSGILGLSVTPLVAAALLALLSVYDIISVYRTHHMVALAGNMLRSGSVFGFLVPARLGGFLMPTRRALDERSVMLLGSGDIGLPLVLAASAVSTSVGAAVMVAVFSLAGLMAMQWMFMHQKAPLPMAALPPIAASAILGYVFAILLNV